MSLIVYQNITIYSIKNIMLPVCVISASIFSMKTEVKKLFMYFLFCC